MIVLTEFTGNYNLEVQKIFFSLLIGSLLGVEREIRRKPAGFRTIALICVGATLFTICSYLFAAAENRDRIAANIITGVGFLGAGVIFRNNANVSGITTAATIWIASALGMLIGIGEFRLAILGLIVAMIILYAMDFIQNWIDARFQQRAYTIVCKDAFELKQFKSELHEFHLKLSNYKETREDKQVFIEVIIKGTEKHLFKFNHWLMMDERIYSFTW